MTLIDRLTSRRGAWLTALVALVVSTAVLGGLRTEADPAPASGVTQSLPATAESRQVSELLERFSGGDRAPALVVWHRADGAPLTPEDRAAITHQAPALAEAVHAPPTPPAFSSDGRAALAPVLVEVDRPNAEIATTIAATREQAAATGAPGLTTHVTGGPAFGADIASAFDGANLTLLAVTLAAVVLLLLLTYRSPVLWLVPLTVVAFADQVAAVLTARAGAAWDLHFDAGIISVLVFGAGTNYALLLISRYREELRREADHRAALRSAWRSTAGAVVASNLTVVLSLLALVLACVPSTSGLGVASAVGLLVALTFALLVLPAALAVVGRRAFWPFVPCPGGPVPRPSVWGRLAAAGMRRPLLTAGALAIVLGALAAPLLGTRVGLAPTEKFRVAADSQTGAQVLDAHFPPGAAASITVIADADTAPAVEAAIRDTPRVSSVHLVATSDGLARFSVTGAPAPGTTASDDLVGALRAQVHSVAGADAKVGGQPAELHDQRYAAHRDLRVVVPVILAVILLVLVLLLRAVALPVVLLAVNSLSALAAIGLGTWVGRHLVGFTALDVNVPLLSFMFLVALGVDYTIFLVHRARDEARTHGAVDGMRRAVSATGAVVTSAGVVLAAVFAALGVLPLMTLTQLGLIVGLGVLLDTLVVRTLLVPALHTLIAGRRDRSR